LPFLAYLFICLFSLIPSCFPVLRAVLPPSLSDAHSLAARGGAGPQGLPQMPHCTVLVASNGRNRNSPICNPQRSGRIRGFFFAEHPQLNRGRMRCLTDGRPILRNVRSLQKLNPCSGAVHLAPGEPVRPDKSLVVTPHPRWGGVVTGRNKVESGPPPPIAQQ